MSVPSVDINDKADAKRFCKAQVDEADVEIATSRL